MNSRTDSVASSSISRRVLRLGRWLLLVTVALGWFGAPVMTIAAPAFVHVYHLPSAINSGYDENMSSLSVDGNTLYFTSNRPGGQGGSDIWVAQRINGVWQPAVNLGSTINSASNEDGPSISSSGDTLYFSSNRPGTRGAGDVYMAVRVNGVWQSPVPLPSPVNTDIHDYDPQISSDGRTLYFTRGSGSEHPDIWLSENVGGTWQDPVNLGSPINTGSYEAHGSPTADGGLLYFEAYQWSGGLGDYDLWVSARSGSVWQTPVNLGSVVNTFTYEGKPTIAPDGKQLYFGSYRVGSFGLADLWVAPVVDEALGIPQGVTATPGDGRVTLAWSPVVGATSYNLYMGETTGGIKAPVSTVVTDPYTHMGLMNGTAYYFVVTAVGANGESRESAEVSAMPTVEAVHGVILHQGWNIASTYIQPADPSLTTMLAHIRPRVVILKNNSGDVYWPEFGINTIGNWDYGQGYQVYMTEQDTLVVTGSQVSPGNTPLALRQGWNTVGYLRNSPFDARAALSTLGNSLVIAKNNYGEVLWPEFGINTIGSMLPGQGYQMYLMQAATLTYPPNN